MPSNRIPVLLITLFLVLFTSFSLSADEDRIIRYGLVPDYPPTTFIDEKGEASGFYIELFTRIMKELGYEPEFIVAPFPELYEKVLADDIDLFSSFLRTAEREQLLYWPSEPTAVGWGQFFVDNKSKVDGIADLEGKEIALIPGEANGENFQAYMTGLKISFTPAYYDNFEELLRAVRQNEVFGGVAGNTLLLGKSGINPTNIVFSALNAFTTCSVTNERMIPLVDAFSTRLGILKENPDSYYWDLYDKWMSTERIETTVFPKWLVWLLAALFVALVTFFFFNRVLHRQVDIRTRELSELNEALEDRVKERTGELEKAHSRLLHSEKTSLTSQLVSGVAHQISTPLGIAITSASFIKSQVNNLARKDSTDSADEGIEDLNQTVELIESNLRKAGNLIRNFRNLAASRNDSDPQIVRLDEYVTEFIISLESEFRKSGCSYELDLQPVVVNVPFSGLSLVIAQLIMNAIWHGYRDKGGVVTVRTRRTGKYAELSVEDKGKGISPTDLHRIFEPFYSTDSSVLHVGLGLNIVENIVEESLNGQVTADSEAGGTTCFTIRIPAEAL